VLGVKLERKGPLGTPRSRWAVLKWMSQEQDWAGVDRTDLTRDTDKC
jgi:hypothetical protein